MRKVENPRLLLPGRAPGWLILLGEIFEIGTIVVYLVASRMLTG